jgi:hypothetical protein
MDKTFIKSYIRQGKNTHSLLVFGLVLVCLVLTFRLAIDHNMHTSVEDPEDEYMHYWYNSMYAHNIGIALSNLKYDLDGYLGYQKVLDIIRAGNISDSAIQKASDVDDASVDGVYRQTVMDLGFIDYTRIAFVLFGYKTESLLYLYFFIFSLAVVAFFIEFYNDNIALVSLLVYLFAHYVVVSATSIIGSQLDTVHNFRFMSVLAVLPVFHICLIALSGKKISVLSFLTALTQAIVIVFVIWIRSSSLWVVLFLLSFTAVILLQHWLDQAKFNFDKRELIRKVLNRAKYNLWPIFVVLGTELISVAVQPFLLDESYYNDEKANKGHTFWEAVYLGLAIHPDIAEKYSNAQIDIDGWIGFICGDEREDRASQLFVKTWLCDYRDYNPLFRWAYIATMRNASDQDGFNAMFKWLVDHGKSEMSVFTFKPDEPVRYRQSLVWFQEFSQSRFDVGQDSSGFVGKPFSSSDHLNGKIREEILFSIIADVVKNHPIEVIELTFVTKPLKLLYEYWTYYINLQNSPPIIMVTLIFILVVVLIKRSPKHQLQQLLFLLLGVLFFSLSIPFATYSASYSISDIALLMTMCILCFLLLCISRYFRWYSAS